MTSDALNLRSDRRPLYIQAKDRLEALIVSGDIRAGEKLPAETELAEQLGISRSTLREALKLAQMEGLIAQRHGLGTYVTHGGTLIPGSLDRLQSVRTMVGMRGLDCSIEELEIVESVAGEEMARLISVEEDEPVLVISRVWALNEHPIAYMVDTLPLRIMPLADLKRTFEGSVLDMLIEQGEPSIDYALTDVMPVVADELLVAKLRVSLGSPLLLAEEILHTLEGEPFEHSLNYHVPGYYRFYVVRRLGI